MSKRNINGKTGKQLYLNQLFLRGMLHTSSEMTEGYARTLTNFDINPTGDSAVPRRPLVSYSTDVIKNNYTYPVKFTNAINHQHYIEFTNTITEQEYVSHDEGNIIQKDLSNLDKGIKMYSRSKDDITRPLLGEGSDTSDLYDKEKSDLNTLKLVLDENDNLCLKTDSEHAFTKVNIEDYTELPGNLESDSKYTELEYLSFDLMDGDSGYFTDNEHDSFEFRFIGVNCPESGNEYYTYGKVFLQILLNNSDYNTILYRYYGKDKYDRNLINAYLKINVDNADGAYVYINLNQVMIRMGLANIDYAFENIYTDNSNEFIQLLVKAKNESNINLNNENNIDYFFNYAHNRISYPTIVLNENSNIKYNNYIVQAVKITGDSHPSNRVSNVIDKVSFVYNDGLDSIGFVGRLVDVNSGFIIYKGPMNIKSSYSRTYDPINGIFSYDCPNFTLYLPDNNLNGRVVNIIDGSTQGFNLLDKKMLHVEDTSITSDPFSILGLSVTDPTQDGTVIVNQAIRGQKVKLNAVTNLGYFYNTNVESTDGEDFGFSIEFTKINLTDIEPLTINKSDFKNNNILTTKLTLETKVDIPVEYDGTVYAGDHGVFGTNDLEMLITNITISSNKGINTSETNRSLLYDNSPYSKINLNSYLKGEHQFIVGNLIQDNSSLFNLAFKLTPTLVTIDQSTKQSLKENYYTYETIVTLELVISHNFDNLSKSIVYNEYTSTLDFIKNNKSKPLSFFTKWERSNSDGTWTVINNDESPTYYTTSDNNIVRKFENKSDDIIWVIDCNGNVQIKYTVTPKTKAVDGDNSWLSDVYVANKFLEIYSIMPIFKIGTSPEYIIESDIRENVDLKNATRIGIFNRQTFLYGPYTKANFIQFSKFEDEYYYPFPYHNVELEEPITYAVTYQDSLVIFCKHNIWMLTGGTSILECTKHKIYENLTTSLTDINLVTTVGTYLMFSNHNMLYILVPNTYSDDPTNVKIYKLSENIINLLNNPEHYLRSRLDIDYREQITNITNINTFSYVQNNEIYIVCNYSFNHSNINTKFVVIFVYNLDYKYWRMYDLPNSIIDYIIASYICEPRYNNQFITKTSNSTLYSLTIFDNNNSIDINKDKHYINNELANDRVIDCYIDSGYLSVDTMNDKRFKDLIIEFDRILDDLVVACNFYIDGTPVLVTNQNALLIDKYNNVKEIENCLDLNTLGPTTKVSLELYDSDEYNFYGSIYKINSDNPVFTSNRTHLRIPLFGKGRLPSFTLVMNSEKPFEFINYSIIYKEKNINRRR